MDQQIFDNGDHPHAHAHFFQGLFTALLISLNCWALIYFTVQKIRGKI